MVTLSPRIWAQLRTIRSSLLTDVQDNWSPCTWEAWVKDRPATGMDTWDNGKKSEAWRKVATGAGMLRANGSGGPVIGESAIWQQAPYTIRLAATAIVDSTMWLVVDGRLFRVEHVALEDPEKPIALAYLTEMFGMALPEVGA